MGIAPKFSGSDITKRFRTFVEVVEKRQVDRLRYLGEMCVKHAKSIPPEIGFMDQTGNLRSSIGYIIYRDGVAIHESFEQVKGGAEGTAKGKALAAEIGKRYATGVVLVVVAGMNYAINVESRGKDVLASAERLAIEELPKMIKALTENIEKAAA